MGKNPFKKSQQLASKFDKATDDKDVEKLKELIAELSKDVEKEDIFFQVQAYYSLATATDSVSKLSGERGDERKASLKKQLYYYRKALRLMESPEFKDGEIMRYACSLQACIATNYGNALVECGRRISAIAQYILAMGYYPFFPMAAGNLGLSYMEYAFLFRDSQAYMRDCLNHYAYILLMEAIESRDRNISSGAKVYFISALSRFHVDYREYLSKEIELPPIPKMTKKEVVYREWCLKNNLFLSPFNDLNLENLSFAQDDIDIGGILTPIEDKMPVVFGIFNQLKQEYISTRYLYFESLGQKSKPHFSDKKTHLAETLDYAQFSLRIEKLKMAFKSAYGLFDKIAYFINAYFDLGIKEKDITFSSIWRSEKSGKNGYKYKNVLNIDNNFPLSSLYWIAQDFDERFGEDSNPELKRLREIRNYLEHKYTIVTWGGRENKLHQKHSCALYISEDELYQRTLDVFRVVREAIICLSLCVNVEENRKLEALGDETVVGEISIGIHEDDWKI